MNSPGAGQRVIDLRSDTVTQPSPEMRRAMVRAPLGDDVFEDDPTVIRLEELAASMLGKEAALFVPSGTMGNLVAVLTHCPRGAEAIVGDQSHMVQYEVAGAAAAAGVQLRTARNDESGRLDPNEVRSLIRGENVHYPPTGLVALENTHNRCFGSPINAADTRAVAEVAHEQGIPVHIDGARIFNAAVALGVPVVELAADADSVGFCLSKGLSAPIGSLLCGPREFIRKARKNRKLLGGGMRQVGVIAAPGIVALETMVDRLAEDHENARRLAVGLAGVPGIRIDPERVRTNIVVFDVDEPSEEWVARAQREGVWAVPFGPRRVRLTTHYGIAGDDITEALERIRSAVAPTPV